MTAEELAYWKRVGGQWPRVETIHGPRAFLPLEPEKIGFKVRGSKKRGGPCAGCVFRTQERSVCDRVAVVAKAGGLPSCDDTNPRTGRTFVYFVRERLQRDLVEEL